MRRDMSVRLRGLSLRYRFDCGLQFGGKVRLILPSFVLGFQAGVQSFLCLLESLLAFLCFRTSLFQVFPGTFDFCLGRPTLRFGSRYRCSCCCCRRILSFELCRRRIVFLPRRSQFGRRPSQLTIGLISRHSRRFSLCRRLIVFRGAPQNPRIGIPAADNPGRRKKIPRLSHRRGNLPGQHQIAGF